MSSRQTALLACTTMELIDSDRADSPRRGAGRTAETRTAASSDTEVPQSVPPEPAATIDPMQGTNDPAGATGVWEEPSAAAGRDVVAVPPLAGLAPTLDPAGDAKG